MSRAPGGFSISNLRAASIFQEYIYKSDPCAPGSKERNGKGCQPELLDCGAPPDGFDNPKSKFTIVAAMIIVAIVIGLINCFALFISVVEREYGMGFVEICFTGALTYAVLIKTSCIACWSIQWVGHRLTAMFGVLLIFIGLLLDSQVIHFAVFYVAHILFIGVGGGLAYSAAMCLPGDLLRKDLAKGMILVSIGGLIGTAVLYWFSIFLLSHISYKWTKLCLAIVTLIFMAATNLFPSYTLDDSCGDVYHSKSNKQKRDRDIKLSVEQAARRAKMQGSKHPDEKSCLCVCVCDVSLWSDWSFLLWGICVMLATMALYVPYMFIISYADSIGVALTPLYITFLCVGSIVGRAGILITHDYTFQFNRLIFIICCILSGILWILLDFVETKGWITVWCAVIGLIEGVLCSVIPRLTLVTVPRRWIDHSWSWILWFHAIGMFIATVFVGIVAREMSDFYVAFLTIGVCQIICGIIAILLPNEEGCGDLPTAKGNCNPSDPCGSFSTYNKYKSTLSSYRTSEVKNTTSRPSASRPVTKPAPNAANNLPTATVKNPEGSPPDPPTTKAMKPIIQPTSTSALVPPNHSGTKSTVPKPSATNKKVTYAV